MREVEPQVFLIGETKILQEGLEAYLAHIGAAGWTTDASTDVEGLAEIMGRLCYRSFGPGLNLNVTRVRGSNKSHLENIVRTGHGSVLEHGVLNFVFVDVSRVFTHELVRHRAGTAVSQESLRFVRLDDLGMWAPTAVREEPEIMEVFVKTFEQLEELQRTMADHYGLDDLTKDFARKKEITSAMRRIAPIGVATSIGWSANVRALRHVLEARTDPGAEEEIRVVFAKVGAIATARYPVLFGDYEIEMVDGIPWYRTKHPKV
ncbi:MAG: FAD-dependent thymidylate synthase [Chloroflexi bacterium]|nr:FAD-dependent thymidylate synthase [Chloroflexota bacterium]